MRPAQGQGDSNYPRFQFLKVWKKYREKKLMLIFNHKPRFILLINFLC